MYKEKYLKYKTKYLELKSQLGGAPPRISKIILPKKPTRVEITELLTRPKISPDDKTKLNEMLLTTLDTNLSYTDVINKITLGQLENHKQELIKLIEDSELEFKVAIDWIEFIEEKMIWTWDNFKGNLMEKLNEIKTKEFYQNKLGFWDMR